MWTTIPSTVAAAVGLLTTAFVSTRDLRLRRRTDTTKGFLDLIAHASGRPRDGRQAVGVAEQLAEQLAAMRMIGSLGRRTPLTSVGSGGRAPRLSTRSGDEIESKVHAAATSEPRAFPRRTPRRARL